MKLKFLVQTLAAAIAISCLSSCDGSGDGDGGGGDAGPPDRDGVGDTYPPRYPDNLDPNLPALFPDTLVVEPTDILELSPATFSVPEIPFPKTDGENDGIILPRAATSLIADSQTYRYFVDGTEAGLLLSGTTRGVNSPSSYITGLIELVGFSGGPAAPFFNRVNDILIDRENAFWITATGFPLPSDPIEARVVIEDNIFDLIGTFLAPNSLGGDLLDIVGYLGVNTPGVVGKAGYRLELDEDTQFFTITQVHLPVENFMVLKRRTITLISSTDNASLINDQEISGDYQIEDVYDVVFFTAEIQEDSFTLTANTGSEFPASDVGYTDAVKTEIGATANGAFTLKLGTLGSSDPNQ